MVNDPNGHAAWASAVARAEAAVAAVEEAAEQRAGGMDAVEDVEWFSLGAAKLRGGANAFVGGGSSSSSGGGGDSSGGGGGGLGGGIVGWGSPPGAGGGGN